MTAVRVKLPDRRPRGSSVDIRISDAPADTAATIERGRILGECTNQARSMANEPGNNLTPRVFAHSARARSRRLRG